VAFLTLWRDQVYRKWQTKSIQTYSLAPILHYVPSQNFSQLMCVADD